MGGNKQRRTKQQNICMQNFALGCRIHLNLLTQWIFVRLWDQLFSAQKETNKAILLSFFKAAMDYYQLGASKDNISYRNKNIVLLMVLTGHIVVLFCYQSVICYYVNVQATRSYNKIKKTP